MKITCNSCGSKYTIADAKVQGKKVKVRCKGCKESILVDGTKIGSGGSADGADDDDNDNGDTEGFVSSPGADEPMASATDEPRNKDLWSVNISDDDSRDMTLQELIAGWKNGTVTSDAYVWKDGMGDWKPILEVGELKLKLGSPPKKGGVVSSASGALAAAGGTDDLFGGVDAAASHPSEVDKPAQAAALGKPTGARNDSSVLFSLDSLNTGGPASPQTSNTADALFAGLDMGVGSLTGNADLLTAPAKEPPPAPAGNRAQPAAPAPASKSKTGLIVAILGAAVIIGGGLVFMGGGDEADAEAAKDESPTADTSEADEKAKKELAEKTAKLKAMEAELKKAKLEAEKKGPNEADKKKEEELKKEKEEAEKKAAEEAEKKGASDTAAASGTSTTTKSDSGKTPAAPSGGAKFDVGAARAALQAASANAAACKTAGGPTGSGKVQITFSTSGRVTSATVVSGPFGGTAVGGCVASTFRRARVPAFSGDPQTVAKSFSIK